MKAALLTDEAGILTGGTTPESAAAYGEYAAERTAFGSNLRGSADYRRALCKVLVRRALLACKEDA